MRIIDKEITGQDLNELADLYFDRMNRRTKRTDEYFKNSPAGRLKALSGKTNRSKYRKVIQELAENVEHLFVAKPAELVEIHNKLVKIQGNANDLRCKEFKKLIDPVFGYYKRFRNSATRGLVHDWFVALNIATCPYCNRNWISHVDTSGKKDGKFLFDIDHYFPQEKYPYFTLSFYNLIPSCTPCNQRLKKNNELSLNSHIHPFVDDIDGLLKFHIPVTAISQFYYKATDIEVILRKPSGVTQLEFERGEAMCTFFELQNLYAKHKDYASEIMQKGVFYDKSTIQELEASFRGKLFENNEEVVRSVFGNYVQSIDIHKRPLAKLTKDLVEQFGIFDSSYSSVTSQKKPRRRIEPVVASKPRN